MLTFLTLILILIPKVIFVIFPAKAEEGLMCPTLCSCNSLDFDISLAVKCTYLDLSDIPTMLNLDSVQYLDISNNQISVLGNVSFPNYNRLSTVILSYNELEDIQVNAFSGLQMLRTIDLSYNNLRSIHPDVFSLNPVLESVSLRSNPLVYLPSDSPILVSGSLCTLDLSSCSLTTIHPVTFSRLPNLYSLDLSSNNLQTLFVDSLDTLPDLTIVELDNNRWTCNCDTVEVMKWVSKRGMHLRPHKPVRCFEGGQYKTFWTASGIRRSCNDSVTTPIVAVQIITDLITDSVSKLTTIPQSLNIQPNSALIHVLEAEETDENEHISTSETVLSWEGNKNDPSAAPENEARVWDSVFAWNENTILVFIILPCTLGIAVFMSLIAVNYFTKRISANRLQHEMQGKDNHLAAFFSDVPLLEHQLTGGLPKQYPGYVSRNSERIYFGEHVYEEIK